MATEGAFGFVDPQMCSVDVISFHASRSKTRLDGIAFPSWHDAQTGLNIASIGISIKFDCEFDADS